MIDFLNVLRIEVGNVSEAIDLPLEGRIQRNNDDEIKKMQYPKGSVQRGNENKNEWFESILETLSQDDDLDDAITVARMDLFNI